MKIKYADSRITVLKKLGFVFSNGRVVEFPVNVNGVMLPDLFLAKAQPVKETCGGVVIKHKEAHQRLIVTPKPEKEHIGEDNDMSHKVEKECAYCGAEDRLALKKGSYHPKPNIDCDPDLLPIREKSPEEMKRSIDRLVKISKEGARIREGKEINLPVISSFATDDEYLWARDVTVAVNTLLRESGR